MAAQELPAPETEADTSQQQLASEKDVLPGIDDVMESHPWHVVRTEEEAVAAVDQIISQLQAWAGKSFDEKDDALVAMQRRLRDRIFEHRRQSPDVTTAFDNRIEEILNFMMQALGTEEDDRSPEAIRDRCGACVPACSKRTVLIWMFAT